MTKEDGNIAILKKAYSIWNDTKGTNADHWLEIMADDIHFRSLANGSDGLEFTSERQSKAEVVEYLKGLSETFEMIHYTVDEYIAQGDRVVAIGSTAWFNRQTGKEFETPKVDVVRFRDGRIVEFFELYDTAMVFAATG